MTYSIIILKPTVLIQENWSGREENLGQNLESCSVSMGIVLWQGVYEENIVNYTLLIRDWQIMLNFCPI